MEENTTTTATWIKLTSGRATAPASWISWKLEAANELENVEL